MLNVLGTTVPVFLLMAVGYAAVRWGLFTKPEIRAMGRLVINFALPALLFLSLAQQPLATIANPEYLLAYGSGSLLVLLLGVQLFRLKRRNLSEAPILALGMANSNSAFVGLPIVLQFFGPMASVAVALTMIIENLVTFPLALGLAEGRGRSGSRLRNFGSSALGVLTNPLILAIVAGTMVALTGSGLPGPLAQAFDMLAQASTPVALFVIGGTLVGLKVRKMIADIAVISVGKLILHPLLVAGFVVLLLPNDPLGRVAIVLAAAPMFSVYPIIGQKYGLEDVCAATLFVATAASFFTLNLLLWLI
jgi:hypothetical protein